VCQPTLYRKLESEGVSYEAVLDGLRHKMALHYLDGRKVSVNQAAYLVGFSDPSAFSCAFMRWTGGRPGGGRQQIDLICPTSARVRQISRLEEWRISGSSWPCAMGQPRPPSVLRFSLSRSSVPASSRSIKPL